MHHFSNYPTEKQPFRRNFLVMTNSFFQKRQGTVLCLLPWGRDRGRFSVSFPGGDRGQGTVLQFLPRRRQGTGDGSAVPSTEETGDRGRFCSSFHGGDRKGDEETRERDKGRFCVSFPGPLSSAKNSAKKTAQKNLLLRKSFHAVLEYLLRFPDQVSSSGPDQTPIRPRPDLNQTPVRP